MIKAANADAQSCYVPLRGERLGKILSDFRL